MEKAYNYQEMIQKYAEIANTGIDFAYIVIMFCALYGEDNTIHFVDDIKNEKEEKET